MTREEYIQNLRQGLYTQAQKPPQSTIEPLPFGYKMPSKNPSIRKLQKLSEFAKNMFKVETPLDAVLAGLAPAKALKAIPNPKDLMFLHQVKPEAIKSYAQMGGVPSPSLAVTQKNIPFEGFGEITLVGKPGAFDPSVNPMNKIYATDAFTPRAPKKIRLAKKGAEKLLAKDYKDIASKYSRGVNKTYEQGQDALKNLQKNNLNRPDDRIDEIERFFDSDIAKIKFLKDTGRNVDNYLEGPKSLGKVDFQATAAALNPNSALYQSAIKADEFKLTREYRDWVAKEKDKYLSQEGVFQYFDDFEETMVTKPYTLDNVVSSMVSQKQIGGEGFTADMIGPDRLAALMTGSFRNLDDIKKSKDRLKSNTPFFDLEGKVDDVVEKFLGYESPDFSESVMMDVGESLLQGSDSINAVKNAVFYQNRYKLNDALSNQQMDDLSQKLHNVFQNNANRPVRYFEAKPQRAVGFDEFAGAIVNKNTPPETINLLNSMGLKVKTYDPFENFDKTKARDAFGKYMFGAAPVGATSLLLQED